MVGLPLPLPAATSGAVQIGPTRTALVKGCPARRNTIPGKAGQLNSSRRDGQNSCKNYFYCPRILIWSPWGWWTDLSDSLSCVHSDIPPARLHNSQKARKAAADPPMTSILRLPLMGHSRHAVQTKHFNWLLPRPTAAQKHVQKSNQFTQTLLGWISCQVPSWPSNLTWFSMRPPCTCLVG